MKHLLRLLALFTLGLLATACTTSSPVTQVITAPDDAADSETITDVDAPESGETVNVTAGRPQFLDSYADW